MDPGKLRNQEKTQNKKGLYFKTVILPYFDHSLLTQTTAIFFKCLGFWSSTYRQERLTKICSKLGHFYAQVHCLLHDEFFFWYHPQNHQIAKVTEIKLRKNETSILLTSPTAPSLGHSDETKSPVTNFPLERLTWPGAEWGASLHISIEGTWM